MTSMAVRLSEDLVAGLDELVDQGRFRTRSDAIRGAIDLLISANARLATDRAIVESYTDQPQTDEEVALAREATRALIEDEPW